MATDFKSIPLIDISPLVEKWNDPDMSEDEGVAQVVQQLHQAYREAGFFYVKGHGIPDTFLKEVRGIARQFFYLPYEEKLKIKLSAATGYSAREVKPGVYGALGKVMEGSHKWPNDPPNFKNLMEYINLCTDLSRKIMRGIALALGGSMDAFEGSRTGDPFWVSRIIEYPVGSHPNGQEKQKNDIGWLVDIS